MTLEKNYPIGVLNEQRSVPAEDIEQCRRQGIIITMPRINRNQILITLIVLLSLIIVVGLYSGINNIFYTTTSTSHDSNVPSSTTGTTTSIVNRPDAGAADTNPITDVTNNTPADTEIETTNSRATPPPKWSTYVNDRYGFSLRVPGTEESTVNYPDKYEECSAEYNGDIVETPFVTVARVTDTELSIAVVCAPFKTELRAKGTSLLYPYLIPEDQEIISTSSIVPNTITRSFTSSTGYTWTIIQTQLDNNHYLEIAHSYGNSNFANNDPMLTEGDFQTILKSLTVK